MKPEINAVDILQSAKPSGLNNGVKAPAAIARILSEESATIFKDRSKVSRNQIIIVAMKMTEKALCRKSFALSHISINTDLADGIL